MEDFKSLLHLLRARSDFRSPRPYVLIRVEEVGGVVFRLYLYQTLVVRAQAGPAWQDLDLIFANEAGRPMEVSNLTHRYFRPLLKTAGLPQIRFHDLRHTAATLMLGAHVDVKVVSEILRHSQVAFTMDRYQHVTWAMQQEAAQAVSALLKV